VRWVAEEAWSSPAAIGQNRLGSSGLRLDNKAATRSR
jgi:hypothetical protein